MKSLVILFFHIVYQIKKAVISGAIGQCPKIPQPSKLPHQVP